MRANSHYDLKTLRLPRLSGVFLRTLVWLLERPWTRWMLQGLRHLGAEVREITLPELDLGRAAHAVTIASGCATALVYYHVLHESERP